jgi:hypothetical protein
MIFSQLEIEIYYVWVWFTNLLVYAVITLRLGSGFDDMAS